jgi:hypothetical protein
VHKKRAGNLPARQQTRSDPNQYFEAPVALFVSFLPLVPRAVRLLLVSESLISFARSRWCSVVGSVFAAHSLIAASAWLSAFSGFTAAGFSGF